MDWIDYREKLKIGFSDEDKFKYFKRKIFNVLQIIANSGSMGHLDQEEYFKFFDTIGLPMNMDYHSVDLLGHCLSIIERAPSLNEFLAYYIAFVNAVKTKKYSENYWVRANYCNLICNKMDDAHIPFDLIEDNEEYFIFPKGDEKMDDALVSQPIHWLAAYPDTYKAYVKALKAYADADSDNASEIADKFRKTLETFFQDFFGGSKNLESYKSNYGTYLKAQGIPKEISGNLEALLQAYTNYMNSYAKHHDKASKNVLEYIMYQTGNIIRLLIMLKKNETSSTAD